jgi:hypothetical protein
MKKILLLAVIFISVNAMAQSDTTTTVEQYARMEATGRMFSTKVTIDIDFGEERSLWSDNRLRDAETGKLKKFNTIIDALNYMGSQGWVMVNAFPVNPNTPNSSPVYHYYFKKTFPK